jgi:AraC-like DNA-binding protein
VSYDNHALFAEVCARLAANPLVSIQTVALELTVGRRTIEKTIKALTGRSSRSLRCEIVLERVLALTGSGAPLLSIKEIAYAVGYQSPRSFARAIRRTCGCTPKELRRRVLARDVGLTAPPAPAELDFVAFGVHTSDR